MLERFVEAQNVAYPCALNELKTGQKRTHWMWYVFPQLKHLGRSYNAKYYGIDGIEEAKEYLRHPLLSQRLREVCEAIINLRSDDAQAIFGRTDAMKLRSSMTLFDAVEPESIFQQVLMKFFDGEKDHRTLSMLET